MYSGGKDSVACIAKLIKEGYRVHLITFDNGCMQFTGYETELALKLELRYGKHKVYWGGVLSNLAYLREHQYLSATMTFSEFIEKYGDFTAGQLQCLNCRTAMYRVAILYARQNGIEYIAEGAREEQLFALEQKPMKEKYEKLCQEFGINLLWPVWKKTDDEIRDYHSDIYLGVSPEFLFPNSNGNVVGELKCPIGMPVEPESIMENPQQLQNRIQKQAVTGAKYYTGRLEPHILEHLLDHENMPLRPSRCGGPVQFSNMGHDPARTYEVFRYDEFLALINSETPKSAPQPLDNMPSRLRGRLVKVKRPDKRIKYSQKNKASDYKHKKYMEDV